ncbi:MAG: DNA-binding response regulator [Deltaproteobacteria bacterium RIFOXYD12_FULL_55_16]|nr:MAG: DNA-binding response regulator [Deltaproteobacteria bacterium RIFOXYD12_FULL_55_16]
MIQPVLIVEDDKKIARVVQVYLEGEGYRVIHAGRGKEAVAAAERETPLLVILDLMLPDMGGEEVYQELKALADVPVIMLTAKSSEEERVAGFALGADDYVVKPFSPRELMFRVKAVLKRAQKQDLTGATVASFNKGILVVDGHRYEVKKKGHSVSLTPTEFKVLFTLAAHPDRVMTRDALVDQALGYQFEGYERSIDAHIKNLRQKIEDEPKRPSFILTVYGIGYKFIGKRDV